MAISVFDILKLALALPVYIRLVQFGRRTFVRELEHQGIIDRVKQLHIELYGSLGATGKGHGTDKAVLLGLEGEAPELVDPSNIPQRLTAIQETGVIQLLQRYPVQFNEKANLLFQRKALTYHANGMLLWYSVQRV